MYVFVWINWFGQHSYAGDSCNLSQQHYTFWILDELAVGKTVQYSDSEREKSYGPDVHMVTFSLFCRHIFNSYWTKLFFFLTLCRYCVRPEKDISSLICHKCIFMYLHIYFMDVFIVLIFLNCFNYFMILAI